MFQLLITHKVFISCKLKSINQPYKTKEKLVNNTKIPIYDLGDLTSVERSLNLCSVGNKMPCLSTVGLANSSNTK